MDKNLNQSSNGPVTQPPVQPTILKPNPKGKWLKILIVAVIVIILISLPAGIYVLNKNSASKSQTISVITQSPTPAIDDISNWKTYVNTKYGFSVKYPSDFSAQDANDENDSWFHRTMICKCTKETVGAFDGPVVIEVIDNPTGKSIEEIIKEDFGFVGNPQFQPITIDSITSKRTAILPGLISTDSVFVNKGSKIFYISLVGNPNQIGISTKTFDQMLQTFKFANSISNLTLQTYTNNQYRFSIQYPDNFVIEDKSNQFPPLSIFFKDKSRTFLDEGGINANPYFSISAIRFDGSILSYINDPNNNMTFIKNATIGTNVFTVVHETHGIGGAGDYYLIKNGNFILNLSTEFEESTDPTIFSNFQNSLLTLKFTQ